VVPVQDWPEGFSAGGKIRNAMQGEYVSLIGARSSSFQALSVACSGA
jgi:hypothetical protein